MYPLYLDKANLFECNINIEGANLKDATSRLLIQKTKQHHYIVVQGQINKKGDCIFNIPLLKQQFNDGETGKVQLQIIVEDTLYKPWQDNCQFIKSKAVVVTEVKMPQAKKPQLKSKVVVNSVVEQQDLNQKLSKILKSNNITYQNKYKNKKLLNQLCTKFVNEHQIGENKKEFVIKTIELLK